MDEAELGFTFAEGVFDGFGGPVGAEAVGGVGFDVAFDEEESAGVAGADVGDEGALFLHGSDFLKAALGFEEDEAGHFAVIEHFYGKVRSNGEAIEDDVEIGGFGEEVGGDHAGDLVVTGAEFAEGVEVAGEDFGGTFGGRTGNDSSGEDIASEGEGLFEKFDGGGVVGVRVVEDEHGDGGGAEVDGCVDRGHGGVRFCLVSLQFHAGFRIA